MMKAFLKINVMAYVIRRARKTKPRVLFRRNGAMLLLSQNCYGPQVQSRHAYPFAGQPELYLTTLTKIANIQACDNLVLNMQCSPGREQEGKVSLFFGFLPFANRVAKHLDIQIHMLIFHF